MRENTPISLTVSGRSNYMLGVAARPVRTTILFLFFATVSCAAEPAHGISEAARADIKLMWETVPMREAHKRASSERAAEAAHRVFTSLRFVGMTREEVVGLLGDPQKSSGSIYNFPFYPTPKDRLVYRFDTGYGGWQFDFSFDRHSRVTKLTPRGIE